MLEKETKLEVAVHALTRYDMKPKLTVSNQFLYIYVWKTTYLKQLRILSCW